MLDFLLCSVVWNTAYEAAPAGGDSPSGGDDSIRELKQATRERLAKEHKSDLSSGTAALEGWHKQGSAISYYAATAPTTRPDGTTALDSSDYGRLWYKTDTGLAYVYTSTGWVAFLTIAYDQAATALTLVQRNAAGSIQVYGISAASDIVSAGAITSTGNSVSGLTVFATHGMLGTGAIHASSTTAGAVFTALNATLSAEANLSFRAVGGMYYAGAHINVSRIRKASSTQYDIYGIDSTGAITNVAMTSGSSTAVAAISIAW